MSCHTMTMFATSTFATFSQVRHLKLSQSLRMLDTLPLHRGLQVKPRDFFPCPTFDLKESSQSESCIFVTSVLIGPYEKSHSSVIGKVTKATKGQPLC